ncbi:hypothetical protein GT755_17225 [Herbidospora sp. NEAU-GS84]|uniref:Uncharacterized protein n=1 Tax=Herbidospora solisilvae TaxID=2696284 RepID=A0A7C9N257_9ACTN|nr:hypothetical protein [Herbidospora solisilvae]NAS23429.1 hypothetical protein [Herbidospora solisilvae]
MQINPLPLADSAIARARKRMAQAATAHRPTDRQAVVVVLFTAVIAVAAGAVLRRRRR